MASVKAITGLEPTEMDSLTAPPRKQLILSAKKKCLLFSVPKFEKGKHNVIANIYQRKGENVCCENPIQNFP